jgi:hypothetical protein
MKWHPPLVEVLLVSSLCGEGVCTNSSIVNSSFFWLHLEYSVHFTDMPLMKNRNGKYRNNMHCFTKKMQNKLWSGAQIGVML